MGSSNTANTLLTFFTRFEADILAGRKTITIRDASERNFQPGSVVTVASYETGRVFCQIKIISVTAVLFSALSDFHAQQENMSLAELKQVISDIYPGEQQLYVISFQRIAKAEL